jgi:hypothetical protein
MRVLRSPVAMARAAWMASPRALEMVREITTLTMPTMAQTIRLISTAW